MRYEFAFDGESCDVIVSASGPASKEGFEALFDDLAADPRFEPGMAVLLDFSDLDVSSITAGVVREIAVIPGANDRLAESAYAVVAPSLVVYGLARLGETVIKPTSLETRVCRTFADAYAWLGERRLPAG